MNLLSGNFLQEALVTWPVILFSLSLHEFFHGWTADRLGDPTARYAGRLTLNPFAHYDLFGTTMALLFGLGWAKPVPVNPALFRWPKRDMMLTAWAGPLTNLCLAVLFAIAARLLLEWPDPPHFASLLLQMAWMGIILNTALAIFNLLPLFPLDGHHILRGFLSFRAALEYDKVKHYSSFVLMGVVIVGGPYLSAVVRWAVKLILMATGWQRLPF